MVTGINFLGLFLEVYAEYSGFEEKNMYIGIWGFCFQKGIKSNGCRMQDRPVYIVVIYYPIVSVSIEWL